MSSAASSALSRPRQLVLPGLCGLLLALAMIRLPVAMDVDPLTAHRAQLYETFRLARDWPGLGTTEGPLAALQAPAYLSGNLWMAFTGQITGSLLLAAILVGAAWRLVWTQRAWALAALAAGLARWPELAPWLVIVVAGHDLVRRWDREPWAVVPGAALLGFLGLFSAGHVVLGAAAIILVAVTARPPLAKILAAASFALALALGWVALGQSPDGIFRWLARALPALGTTSATWRQVDVEPFAPWAFVSAFGLAVVLVRHHRSAPEGQRSLPGVIFLAIAAWFAWKAVALQTYGQPLVFFATVMLAGFLLWHRGCPTRWAAALLLLGLTGLARGHPDFLPDALGHFNRRILNTRQLLDSAQFRSDVRAQVSMLRGAHSWPKLQAIIGRSPVGADADALPRALFNNLAVVYPADLRAGPDAPAFVVQRLAASVAQPPAFVDAPAQLALYRNYELQAEESGVLLWRRRAAETPAPVEVATGTLDFGEPLKLPAAAPGTAYWLELDFHPNLPGRLWSLLDELSAPGLIVRDESGTAVRYALPPAVGARGFLLDPFIRGNAGFQRWQRGEPSPRVTEISLVLPPANAWLWAARYRYRLYAVSGLALSGHALAGSPAQPFRAFNRPPVGAAYALPFVESPSASRHEALFFVHPDSIVEFAVHGTDRRVRGNFGIGAGAYDRPGKTDGVDFSIEFVGLDGSRRVLLHRYLNPASEAADRGFQAFDLALPGGTDGRLLLRSFNPPWRTAAWDWAFWHNVIIE